MIQPTAANPSTLLRTLGQNQQAAGRATTRLATGSQLNAGKDGPAALISSTRLRAMLETLEAESAVYDRQDQIAATADGYLAEASRLQTESRGLEVALADPTRSAAERDALQSQLDANNRAIDRLGQSATFNGQRLFSGDTTLAVDGVSVTLPRLTSDTDTATVRGQLGAYQSQTLAASRNAAAVAAESTAAANSVLADTDYAAEAVNLRTAQLRTTANLQTLSALNDTRAQVLNLLG